MSETVGFQPAAGFWRHRNVYVTGASGLLGGWLVQELAERGANVVALVRDDVRASRLQDLLASHPLTICRGDVRDYEVQERILNEYEIDAVFHLAAQTIVQTANRAPLSTFQTNVGGTWNVLEAARRVSTVRRIVVASSDKAYGSQPRLPYAEDMPLQGEHPYDVSKSCTDLIARAYAVSYGLPVCVTRCGNFFGGGDLNFNRIIPGTIRSVLHGERPVVRSDGHYVRDYLFVREGALAYLHVAEAMEDPALHGEAFNFSTGAPMSVLEVVLRLLGQLGSSLEPIVLGKASNEIREQFLDSSKARRLLGWTSRIPLDQALAETIAWYRAFFAGPTSEPSPRGSAA